MTLENYIEYLEITSGQVSDDLDLAFILHKSVCNEIYLNLSGFPSIQTFYGGDDFEQTELLSIIKTPDVSYMVHSLNQRDLIAYVIDPFCFEITRKYGRAHLEQILPKNYVCAYFSSEFKLSEGKLLRSKNLLEGVCYKLNVEEKIDLDGEEIIAFFNGLSFLDIDTEEAIDKTIL